jgi:hypothetical protein
MRRCGGDGIKRLAACGLVADEVIPSGFTVLIAFSPVGRCATGAGKPAVACSYCGLEAPTLGRKGEERGPREERGRKGSESIITREERRKGSESIIAAGGAAG